MSGGPPPWAAQSGFDVRLCRGPNGVMALGAGVGAVAIVDVLRFTTALDVAVSTGARVFPFAWPPSVGPDITIPEGTVVADGHGPRGLSLSPATLTALQAGGAWCCLRPTGRTAPPWPPAWAWRWWAAP